MAHPIGLGNFINGSFKTGNIEILSSNPSRDFAAVFSTTTDEQHVSMAISAAQQALLNWAQKSFEQKVPYFLALKQAFIKHEEVIAETISQEMGKIKSEALLEAKSLSARIDLMLNQGIARVKTEILYELRAETRYHQQGVLAVIGPFNFPAHLVNAHVIPALLMGNAVIVKPSELCPWVAELYASCFLEAGFPPGIYNLLQGDGRIGKALCAHPAIDGILFTGSYQTGRALKELLLDQPHKILALEMGGKNFAIVMDDADLEQALLEVAQGAFLTTGQRCTATSRVLLHERIKDNFTRSLVELTKKMRPDIKNNQGFYGPLASKAAFEKFFHGLTRAKEEGAQVLLESEKLGGGAFVSPSIYQISSSHPMNAYLSEELFGPNIALESFTSLDEAIVRVNQSPFGLSNSIFSLDSNNADRLYRESKSGVLNFNRSTNGAYGQMPFGGLNKSGNQRPAGIDAVRYASFPVAISSLAYGESAASAELKKLLVKNTGAQTSLAIICLRHEIEKIFEAAGIHSDEAALDRLIYSTSSFNLGLEKEPFFAGLKEIFGNNIEINNTHLVFLLDTKLNAVLDIFENYVENHAAKHGLVLSKPIPLKMHIPENLEMPRSRAMLDRLYRGNFVPKEKKTPVIDLHQCHGSFLTSVDDNPLVLIDAASQIATLGAGFNADTFQNAYDTRVLDINIRENYDLSQGNDDQSTLAHDAHKAKLEFESFLHKQSHEVFSSIAYGASGAEANEIAFDMCRQHGPGGTRIIAFEGAFHGRTIMALQATYNKEKRGPFMFQGYEASFVPFPKTNTPEQQPAVESSFLSTLASGKIPSDLGADPLLKKELESLKRVKEEIEKDKICAVIIEPMQCEGGDQYATNRFYNGLRALTRAYNVPLIFDEVQTGFHLGRSFFWHHQFNLHDSNGKPETPDCLTMGKKAQLGVCLSVWPNQRSYSPHIIQLKRGLLHAKSMRTTTAKAIEEKVKKELHRLEQYFPNLVMNGRANGFAFAFDMATAALANHFINQRFERGFMAYIAGEKTLRFRANMTTNKELIRALFEKLFVALVDIRDGLSAERKAGLKLELGETCTISNIKIHELNQDNFSSLEDKIRDIEDESYEPGRRDTMATLKEWLTRPHSLGLSLSCTLNGEDIFGGYIIGGPLEFSHSDGPKQDPLRGENNSFYSANFTLDKRIRGKGLGTMLKNEQVARVRAITDEHGAPRYQFLCGRNRIDLAAAMTHINMHLGAYTVKIYDHQYGEENASALYYRLPLRKSWHKSKPVQQEGLLVCGNTIEKPFQEIPAGLEKDLQKNRLRPIVGSKLTLSNWATPNLVRYSELLRAVMPCGLKHTYFTSGRDEVVDKGLRSLRFHRLDADIAIGFSHQWLGNISAAARSLSHDASQAQPFKWFNWPHVPHPGVVGNEQSLSLLKEELSKIDPKKVLGIVVELIGEKSALSFSENFLSELDTIRQKTGIPLVFVETASALGRSGASVFYSDSLKVKPNMVWWYTGAQLGHIFVDDNYFVEKPLTLISTWDGDEISIVRSYHHLVKASSIDLRPINELSLHLKEHFGPNNHRGLGAWHAIKPRSLSLNDAINLANSHGVMLEKGFDDWLMLCPRVDSSAAQYARIVQTIRHI